MGPQVDAGQGSRQIDGRLAAAEGQHAHAERHADLYSYQELVPRCGYMYTPLVNRSGRLLPPSGGRRLPYTTVSRHSSLQIEHLVSISGIVGRKLDRSGAWHALVSRQLCLGTRRDGRSVERPVQLTSARGDNNGIGCRHGFISHYVLRAGQR